MEDKDIVALYFARSEEAITETEKKYGRYCRFIASNILASSEDAEECVNDAYMRAWMAIPPSHPILLSSFLGKITRNLALNRLGQYSAQKRGGGQVEILLSELDDCIPAKSGVEQTVDGMMLSEAIDCFLEGLPELKRRVFVQRYWYLMPISEIARDNAVSENRVKLMLYRIRIALRSYLEKEGITF